MTRVDFMAIRLIVRQELQRSLEQQQAARRLKAQKVHAASKERRFASMSKTIDQMKAARLPKQTKVLIAEKRARARQNVS